MALALALSRGEGLFQRSVAPPPPMSAAALFQSFRRGGMRRLWSNLMHSLREIGPPVLNVCWGGGRLSLAVRHLSVAFQREALQPGATDTPCSQ